MIENNWEFLYYWGTQGILFIAGYGLGIAYQKLKNNSHHGDNRIKPPLSHGDVKIKHKGGQT